MDDLRARTVLYKFLDGCDDDEVRAALVLMVPELVGFPPTAVAHATHEARLLAQQFAKTALWGEWSTPPQHSKAMERLIHRLTRVLESMLDLLTEANNMEIRS